MPIDWTSNDLSFLAQKIVRGEVVLFVGAGFSYECRNRFDSHPPLGNELAHILATNAGFPYSGESLPLVYESVARRIGTAQLWNLLREHYEIVQYPDWYNIVCRTVWHRVFTTNIDNLLQHLYSTPNKAQKLETIVCPARPQERDALFATLQCVHLHGSIGHPGQPLTFSLSDFAGQTTTSNPWYQTLVDDLYTRPVVFIGTQLEEPPLHHYLELREVKPRDTRETKPKSFLISPKIGPIRSGSMESRNISCIEATASEFFQSLHAVIPSSDRSVPHALALVYPHVVITPARTSPDPSIARYFEPIVADHLPQDASPDDAAFFLGAEPRWMDIAKRRDAPRDIDTELLTTLTEKSDTFRSVVIHGPAGAGKTTSLMRTAVHAAEAGIPTYFAKNEERIDFSGILNLACQLKESNRRLLVFVDGLNRHLPSLLHKEDAIKEATNLTLCLCDRTNIFNSRCQAVRRFSPVEMRMPDLSERDVTAVLERLEAFGFLGELRAKSAEQRVAAFMERAEKQLLVALREATSGQGFDVILRSEFAQLERHAQLAYTMCCLAVAKGAPGVYKKHLLPAIGITRARAAALLADNLRGVVISANVAGSMLKPRHRLIGHWVAQEIADTDLKLQATRSLLISLSGYIEPGEIVRRSPAYLAYRGLINANGLMESFNGDTKLITGLYADVKDYYEQDFLFWLQYGMAQMEAGKLDLAENFFNQSLSIRPHGNFQTLNQMGILYLRQATESPQPGAFVDKASRGLEILLGEIKERGDIDAYPYATYLRRAAHWYDRAGALVSRQDWADLLRTADVAEAKYQGDQYVMEAVKEARRLYMMQAVAVRGQPQT